MALFSLRLRAFAPLREMFYKSADFFTASDARGTRRRRKRKFLVEKTRIYGIAMQTSALEVCGSSLLRSQT
jgi:hypothetical protein